MKLDEPTLDYLYKVGILTRRHIVKLNIVLRFQNSSASQKDIANLMGVSKSHVSKTLRNVK